MSLSVNSKLQDGQKSKQNTADMSAVVSLFFSFFLKQNKLPKSKSNNNLPFRCSFLAHPGTRFTRSDGKIP